MCVCLCACTFLCVSVCVSGQAWRSEVNLWCWFPPSCLLEAASSAHCCLCRVSWPSQRLGTLLSASQCRLPGLQLCITVSDSRAPESQVVWRFQYFSLTPLLSIVVDQVADNPKYLPSCCFSGFVTNGLISFPDSERIRLHVLNFLLFEAKIALETAALASSDSESSAGVSSGWSRDMAVNLPRELAVTRVGSLTHYSLPLLLLFVKRAIHHVR